MSEDEHATSPDPSGPPPSDTAPVRRILHCDMDCFYAAVEMRDDPQLRGRPVVVGGDPDKRGVVAAASYEARRFGIRSAMPAARARRLCPQVVFLRPDFRRYREESEAIFSIYREFTPTIQPLSLDEAYLDVSDHLAPGATAMAVAQEIRRRVREERRLTVSVGVGPNKLIAKIASDHRKPDGLTVVHPSRVLDFLAPLEVRQLMGVGAATEARLHAAGIRTIGELRTRSREELTSSFGRYGGRLWEFARGIDSRPVSTDRQRKSLSSERTYAEDLTDPAEMRAELERQARGVAESLAKRSLRAGGVAIKVRYDDFTTVTRSTVLAEPSCDPESMAAVAGSLLARTEAGERPVRLLGVGGYRLVGEGEGEPAEEDDPQLGLFGRS